MFEFVFEGGIYKPVGVCAQCDERVTAGHAANVVWWVRSGDGVIVRPPVIVHRDCDRIYCDALKEREETAGLLSNWMPLANYVIYLLNNCGIDHDVAYGHVRDRVESGLEG